MTVAAVDLRITPDLGTRWALSSGNACLAEDLICALSSDEGSLIYAPGWGYNVLRQLNGTFTQTAISQLNSRITAQCLLNPKVQAAACSAVYNGSTNTLTVNLQIEGADGPFALVLLVSQLSVDILNANDVGIPAATATAGASTAPSFAGPPGAAGAPGPASSIPGPAGPPGPGGNSTQSFSAGSESEGESDDSGTEIVFWQFTLNAGNHPGGALNLDFTMQGKSPGGTAVWKAYVGGNYVDRFAAVAGVGGTAVGAPVNNSSAGYAAVRLSGTFTNPTGIVPVTITLTSPVATVAAFGRTVNGTITP